MQLSKLEALSNIAIVSKEANKFSRKYVSDLQVCFKSKSQEDFEGLLTKYELIIQNIYESLGDKKWHKYLNVSAN